MAKWKIDFTPYLASIILLTVIPGFVTADQNLVTQTVYGFLDFTTTIGNTVMVFSPQSADSAASEKSKPSEPTVNTVIETKPITSTPLESSPVITPSKTEEKEGKKSSEFNKKTSTVIDAKSKPPANSKSEPKKQVNVVQKTSSSVVSAVNIVNAVTTSPPEKKSVITKVEVVQATTATPIIVSSKVEIQEASTSHVVATPVIGKESETSSDNKENDDDDDDEPAVILQNNIGEPEYDFLSRQPSEFVEETYKVCGRVLGQHVRRILFPKVISSERNKVGSRLLLLIHALKLGCPNWFSQYNCLIFSDYLRKNLFGDDVLKLGRGKGAFGHFNCFKSEFA